MTRPLDRRKLKEQIHELYRREHAELGRRGTLERLERGRQWDLAPTLRSGGVVVFPHAGVADCGHQVAAAVHACLDSGADRVLVISVLHAFTDEMDAARADVSAGGDPSAWPFWGIQGPGIAGRDEWRDDHALISFRHFWAAETTRRGIRGPEVVERYPYLAGGRPERLPGIEELVALADDAVIVSTADPFHHGIGYGDPPERSLPPDDEGLALARSRVGEGIALLAAGDYAGYDAHCVDAKSDARDAGVVFHYLRGELEGAIVDLAYSDAAALYAAAEPTWVAAPLVEWQRPGGRSS